LKDISSLSFYGKTSNLYLFIKQFLLREAAILVLGVVSGFKSNFKSVEPMLKSLVPALVEELSNENS
jgi:hypothetical protein